MASITSLKSKIRENPIQLDPLRDSGRVLSCCSIAREKIQVGDYDAGCAVLTPWWKLGEWPTQHGLEPVAAGTLLLTAGSLTDSVVRVRRMPGGQRLAEALLSGAIALFDHLGESTRAIEARIELGCCYYHQGLFDIAHFTLNSCVEQLTSEHVELKAVALIRLAIVERHSGRLQEAFSLLEPVSSLEKISSAWTKGRFRTEMANTLKALGVAEGKTTISTMLWVITGRLHYSLSKLETYDTSPQSKTTVDIFCSAYNGLKNRKSILNAHEPYSINWETRLGVPKLKRPWPNSALRQIDMILRNAPSNEPSIHSKVVVRTLSSPKHLLREG